MTADLRTASAKSSVAAFDFDKTLSTRDCVLPFLCSVVTPAKILGSARDLPSGVRAVVRRNRDEMKEIVSRRAFAGLARRTLEDKALQFAEMVHERWMRLDMLDVVSQHQSMGHRIGIVSASYGMYLRPIGQKLGLDFVIATELEFDDDDRATGRLVDGNCRGPQKARRLRGWLSNNGLEGAVLHAYGDSAGDREMLAMADHPHRVGKVFSS